MGETRAHRRLKRLAAAYLVRHGCQAAAIEVKCPISRYRVDVAGYVDRQVEAAPIDPASPFASQAPQSPEEKYSLAARRRRMKWASAPPRTIMLECKQSRADYLRDARDVADLLERREKLTRISKHIEVHRIQREEPHLRQADTALFTDLEQWDYGASRSRAYRSVLRRVRRIDAQLYGETKFAMIAHYRLANRLYIVSPEGLIQPGELPAGWGLIECRPEALDERRADVLFDEADPPLRVTVPAPELDTPVRHHGRMLRNIAVSATAALWR